MKEEEGGEIKMRKRREEKEKIEEINEGRGRKI